MIRWVLTGLGVAGAFLNVRQHRACFALWGVANAGWMLVHGNDGDMASVVLFGVYLVLAVYGLTTWRARKGGLELPPIKRARL